MNSEEKTYNKDNEIKKVQVKKRLIQMYKDEIEGIEKQLKDVELFEEAEEGTQLEEEARLFYRHFSRIFYDLSAGEVSNDEFLPLWERKEEICSELEQIESLEAQKKEDRMQIAKERNEEHEMDRRNRLYQQKHKNFHSLFASFGIMAAAAAVFAVGVMIYFGVGIADGAWALVALVSIAGLLLVVLWRLQKDAKQKEQLYRSRQIKKRDAVEKLQADYSKVSGDLAFYYDKYENLFSYISEHQWRMLPFCLSIMEALEADETLVKEQKEIGRLFRQNGYSSGKVWSFDPKVLYDRPRRKAVHELLTWRKEECEKNMMNYRKELGEIK